MSEQVWLGYVIDLPTREVRFMLTAAEHAPLQVYAMTLQQFAGQGPWMIDMLSETLRRARAMIELIADGANEDELDRQMQSLDNEWRNQRSSASG